MWISTTTTGRNGAPLMWRTKLSHANERSQIHNRPDSASVARTDMNLRRLDDCTCRTVSTATLSHRTTLTYQMSKCALAFISLLCVCCLLVTPADSFSQGSMIESSFESTYCREGVSALSRGPMHYDLRRCRGQCSPTRAPRTMYRMVVNASTYAVDTVEVEIRANARRGANILGFAVVAISEDGATAGRWVVDEEAEEPEVLRATCDSLLEGQVIFHARPSEERTSVKVIWNPRKTNYGSVIFRAWIVQSMESILVVDSPPLSNPLDGRNFMEIEAHFRSLLDAMEISSSPKTESRSVTNRPRTATEGSQQNLPPLSQRRIPNPTRADSRITNDDLRRDVRPSNSNTNSARERTRPSQREVFNSETFTMEQFEEAFLARMASGFDLSGPDPFSEFEREMLQMSDLVPESLSPLPMDPALGPLGDVVDNSASAGPAAQTLPGQNVPVQPSAQSEFNPFPDTNPAGIRPGSPVPFQWQQQNMMNPAGPMPNFPGLDPRLHSMPWQNQFRANPNTPWAPFRNLMTPTFNPMFLGQSFPQQSTGSGRDTMVGNGFPGSSVPSGFNNPFTLQRGGPPNANQWGPNWNTANAGGTQMLPGLQPSGFGQSPRGVNWGFQSGGQRQLMPNWNNVRNQAGQSWSLPGISPNQFGSNFNLAPNPPTNPSFGRNQAHINPTLNSHNFVQNQFGRSNNLPSVPGTRNPIAGSLPTPNGNRMIPSAGNSNNDSNNNNNAGNSLGSFSELLHAAGGWGSQ